MPVPPVLGLSNRPSTAAPISPSGVRILLLGLLMASLTILTGPTVTADGAPRAKSVKLSNGCAYSQRGIPRCGAYLGAAYGANTDPAPLERSSGRRLGVRRTYFRGDQVDGAVRTAAADLKAGRLPWISFKLPYSWEDMAAGRGDSWARSLTQRLSRLPGPVWLAFHHEPEGDGDIQAWRRMQERLAPLVRQSSDNVAFTVIVTGWNQLFGDPKYGLDRIWPRGVKVDIAGFDVYNEYGVTKRGKKIDDWPMMGRNYFKPLSAWARRNNVRWAIAEIGLTHEASSLRKAWIARTHRRLVRQGGIAMAYFDTEVNAYGTWPLTTTAKRRDFSRAIRRTPALKRP